MYQKLFKQEERKRVRYTYGGKKVCRGALQHIVDVGRRSLAALLDITRKRSGWHAIANSPHAPC